MKTIKHIKHVLRKRRASHQWKPMRRRKCQEMEPTKRYIKQLIASKFVVLHPHRHIRHIRQRHKDKFLTKLWIQLMLQWVPVCSIPSSPSDMRNSGDEAMSFMHDDATSIKDDETYKIHSLAQMIQMPSEVIGYSSWGQKSTRAWKWCRFTIGIASVWQLRFASFQLRDSQLLVLDLES